MDSVKTAPEAATGLDVSEVRSGFWVAFNDGLAGFVTLDDLGAGDLRDELVAESARVGEDGETVELTTRDKKLFEIDAASLRALLDRDFSAHLRQSAAESDAAVGARVRACRENAGVTQTELGQRARIDQAVISRLERGKHQPRIDTLRRIAEALETSVSGLLA